MYDADNRLTSQTTSGQTTTFSYDANGSMVERSSPGETLAYAWDTAARLTEITRNGSSQATFAYDGDGNCRSKTSGGQTTTYVNDARGLSQVLQATTGSNVVTYVPGLAQHDASKPTEAAKWGYSLSDWAPPPPRSATAASRRTTRPAWSTSDHSRVDPRCQAAGDVRASARSASSAPSATFVRRPRAPSRSRTIVSNASRPCLSITFRTTTSAASSVGYEPTRFADSASHSWNIILSAVHPTRELGHGTTIALQEKIRIDEQVVVALAAHALAPDKSVTR